MKIIVDKLPNEPWQCLFSVPDDEGLKAKCSLKVKRSCDPKTCILLKEEQSKVQNCDEADVNQDKNMNMYKERFELGLRMRNNGISKGFIM